jgi:hypothetical protein
LAEAVNLVAARDFHRCTATARAKIAADFFGVFAHALDAHARFRIFAWRVDGLAGAVVADCGADFGFGAEATGTHRRVRVFTGKFHVRHTAALVTVRVADFGFGAVSLITGVDVGEAARRDTSTVVAVRNAELVAVTDTGHAQTDFLVTTGGRLGWEADAVIKCRDAHLVAGTVSVHAHASRAVFTMSRRGLAAAGVWAGRANFIISAEAVEARVNASLATRGGACTRVIRGDTDLIAVTFAVEARRGICVSAGILRRLADASVICGHADVVGVTLALDAHADFTVSTGRRDTGASVGVRRAHFVVATIAVHAHADREVFAWHFTIAAVSVGQTNGHRVFTVAFDAHRGVEVFAGVLDGDAATASAFRCADFIRGADTDDAHASREVATDGRLATAPVVGRHAGVERVRALTAEAHRVHAVFARVRHAAVPFAGSVAGAVHIVAACREAFDLALRLVLTAAVFAELVFGAISRDVARVSGLALVDGEAAAVIANLADQAVFITITNVCLAFWRCCAAAIGAELVVATVEVFAADRACFALFNGCAALIVTTEPAPTALRVVLAGPHVGADFDAEAVVAKRSVVVALPRIAALVACEPELFLAVDQCMSRRRAE